MGATKSSRAGTRRATRATERAKQAKTKAKAKAAHAKKRVVTFDIESKDTTAGEMKGFTRPFKGALPDDAEPRILSLDDLMSGRARVALGLASEEEESARNALFDEVYDDQRKRGWPGL